MVGGLLLFVSWIVVSIVVVYFVVLLVLVFV